MSRTNRQPHAELRRHTVGNALVVHRPGDMTGAAKALALTVAEDPEHDLVVVDLPAGLPAAVWSSVAATLPRGRRGVRLVVGGRARETATLAGQWLADRLHRTVIAHDGAVVPAAGGTLFVHSGRDSGWVRFEPGRTPRWEAKRFPRPSWDAAITAETTPTSALGVAEPLPSGLWIRPVGAEDRQHEQRARLVELSPQQSDFPAIVLGSPGGPALSLDDVTRIWVRLPARVRSSARFIHYGPMALPAGTGLGQALADLLDEEIVCYTGVPVGDAAAPVVRAVLHDGTFGWAPYARELAHRPGADLPVVASHRPPLPDLRQLAPTVYWYALDAVIEVVQSGLLVRPPVDGPHTAEVRALAPDPTRNRLVFDGPAELAERLRLLAEDLAARLDPAVRQATVVTAATDEVDRPVSRAAEQALASLDPAEPPAVRSTGATEALRAPAPAVAPQPAPAIVTAVDLVVERPSPAGEPRAVSTTGPGEPAPEPAGGAVAVPVRRTRVAAQPTPRPEAAALLAPHGIADEREWLRRTLAQEYGTLANAVARVLSEHPGLQGRSSTDALTDAVAVRIYLSAAGAAIDGGLRGATVGPHVPLARCVVSGLSRLPSHRGVATFSTTVDRAQWDFYRAHPAITDWGFVNALTGPCADLPGDTDVLVWSMTARRTRLLEPDTGGAADRVLFVPGTSFAVLELTEPAPGARGRLLLRELSPGEVDETGRVAAPAALTDLAMTSLRRTDQTWAAAPRTARVAPDAVARFGALPGLDTTAQEA
ncbi:hypothetical protein [Actinophytocola sp.]|uniref:hypothetical protein n=1 Tax=Actinophytocola sp. TaxID=1872138 RepID=UPI002D409450|nr:hypothetical protein [Actinophytocola sp.]HYQ66235.1 hypothetical protein [Actinophytocola sp.]